MIGHLKKISLISAVLLFPISAFAAAPNSPAAGGSPLSPNATLGLIGTLTPNHCIKAIGTSTIGDSGSVCSGGGGTPGGTSGQTQYNNSGAFAGYTMGGDCTLVASTGVITCTKTSGTSFTAGATTAIGTSGAVLGLLNGNLTLGGTDTFTNAPTVTAFSTAGVIANNSSGVLSSTPGPTQRSFGFNIGCLGVTPGVGQYGLWTAPYAGTITNYSLGAEASSSAVVDLWKATGTPPTSSAQSITASALPTLSASRYVASTDVGTWTTSFAKGDVFIANLNSVSGSGTCFVLQIATTTN